MPDGGMQRMKMIQGDECPSLNMCAATEAHANRLSGAIKTSRQKPEKQKMKIESDIVRKTKID